MAPGVPIKKLFTTALFTSVLIGTLAMATIAAIHPVPMVGFLKGLIHHSFFILFFWAINISIAYLTEKYSRGKHTAVVRYILSYIVCIVLVLFTRTVLKVISGHHDTEFFLHNNPAMILGQGEKIAGAIMGFTLNTIVLIIQDLVLLREKKTRIELENAELKVRNVESINQQLKQQVHPHFLFNSLSTLKSLIKKDPAKAEEYLLMLSDFLRGAIATDTPNTVNLEEELGLCRNYLEMQKIRFGETLQYTISIPTEVQSSGVIPVFSILPLLENAIKHNSMTNESPLHIRIEYSGGRIVIINNLQPKAATEQSTGIGLENLKERYRILSGDKIIVSKNENTFSVSIPLLANEDSDHRG